MGLNSSKQSYQDIPCYSEDFIVLSTDKETSSTVIRNSRTDTIYLMKSLNLTSIEEFTQMEDRCRLKKIVTSKHHEHFLGLEEYYTKCETSFCSAIYKITMLYQFSIHSLQQEIEARFAEERPFQEKEIWSILCSCTLALAFLEQHNVHLQLITCEDILLTTEGVVKMLDPQAKSTEVHSFLPIKRDRYYSPQSLGRSYDREVTNCKSGVFSLAMCLMEVMYLEPINECYDYEQGILKESSFNNRVKRLESLKYSPVLIGLIKKMLCISVKDRLSISELEHYLFRLIEDNELSEHSGIRADSTPTHDESGIVQPKSLNEQDDIEHQKDIISSKLLPMDDQPEEHRSDPVESVLFECETLDDEDIREITSTLATDRRKNLERTVADLPQQLTDMTRLSKELMNKSNVNSEETLSDFKHECCESKHATRPLVAFPPNSSHSQVTANVKEHSRLLSDEDLFTDPKLLEMLREDLQIINMKKSKKEQSKGKNQAAGIGKYLLPNFKQLELSQIGKENCHITKHVAWDKKVESSTVTNRYSNSCLCDAKQHTINPALASSRELFSVDENVNVNNYKLTHSQHHFERHNPQHNRSEKNLFSCDKLVHELNNIGKKEPVFTNETYSRGRYEGFKLNDQRHGFGTFYYKEDGRYSGNWKANKMHGKGILYYSDNKIAYDGNWQNDRLWGYGTLYNEQPKSLKGSYDYNCWDEVDDFWIRYQGDFVEDNKTGFGRLFLTNGQKFEGTFQNDEVNGEGVFYKIDGRRLKGIWKDNRLVRMY